MGDAFYAFLTHLTSLPAHNSPNPNVRFWLKCHMTELLLAMIKSDKRQLEYSFKPEEQWVVRYSVEDITEVAKFLREHVLNSTHFTVFNLTNAAIHVQWPANGEMMRLTSEESIAAYGYDIHDEGDTERHQALCLFAVDPKALQEQFAEEIRHNWSSYSPNTLVKCGAIEGDCLQFHLRRDGKETVCSIRADGGNMEIALLNAFDRLYIKTVE